MSSEIMMLRLLTRLDQKSPESKSDSISWKNIYVHHNQAAQIGAHEEQNAYLVSPLRQVEKRVQTPPQHLPKQLSLPAQT